MTFELEACQITPTKRATPLQTLHYDDSAQGIERIRMASKTTQPTTQPPECSRGIWCGVRRNTFELANCEITPTKRATPLQTLHSDDSAQGIKSIQLTPRDQETITPPSGWKGLGVGDLRRGAESSDDERD